VDCPVPHYGTRFPDGWSPPVRALVTALAAADPYAAVVAAEFTADDVVNLGGLLVAALDGLGVTAHLPAVAVAAARDES